MPMKSKHFFLLSLALSFYIKTNSQLCLPGIVPCVPETDCRCNLFEFTWVVCFFQICDCADYCTISLDINELTCRLWSTCAWNTGTGLGGCESSSLCTDEEQREESIREQFMEAFPLSDDYGWEFPGPCADSFGEDWEYGLLNYGETSGSYISQWTEDGNIYNSPDKAMRTFDGENRTDFESAAKECFDSATYNGDRTYTYSKEKCYICLEQIPFFFNSTNQILDDDYT